MARTPQTIVPSITGKIKVFARTDQTEKELNTLSVTGIVAIVQLIVGRTYPFTKSDFPK